MGEIPHQFTTNDSESMNSYLFIYSFIQPSFHSSIYLFIYSCIYLFIYRSPSPSGRISDPIPIPTSQLASSNRREGSTLRASPPIASSSSQAAPSAPISSTSTSALRQREPLSTRIENFSEELRSRGLGNNHQQRSPDATFRPIWVPLPAPEQIEPHHFELITQYTFGAKGERCNKSLSLGTVLSPCGGVLHYLVTIRDFDPVSHVSTGGVRLFVEQYTVLMQCLEMFSQAFKPVLRGEKALVKLQLGPTFGVVLNSKRDQKVHIALFKRNNLEEPTLAQISLTREEWESLCLVSLDFVKALVLLKENFSLAPPDVEHTFHYHGC